LNELFVKQGFVNDYNFDWKEVLEQKNLEELGQNNEKVENQ